MTNKQKIWLYVGIGLLVLMIAVGIYFYKRGKNTNVPAPLPPDNPNLTTDPNASSSGAGYSGTQIASLANQAYDDMNGWNINGHNSALWQQIDQLSDTDLVNLSNAFNAQYQAKTGSTFLQWLSGEHAGSIWEAFGSGLFGGAGTDSVFGTVQADIEARLGKYNIV